MSENETKQPSASDVLLEAEALIQRLEVALKAIAKSGDGEFMQGHAEHHLNTTCHRAKKVRRQLVALATAPQSTPEREALGRQIREALERNWQAWPFATPHGVAGYLATALCPPAEAGEAQ